MLAAMMRPVEMGFPIARSVCLFAFCLRCAARLGILPIARSTRSVPRILPMSSSLTFRAE